MYIYKYNLLQMKSFFEKRYSVRLIWILVLILIISGYLLFSYLYYHYNWSGKESFDFTFKYLLWAVGLSTLLYHLHNLEYQIRTQETSNRQNKAKYTYDICSDWRKPEMMEIIEDVRLLLLDKERELSSENLISEFVAYVDNPINIKKRMSLILTLNYFESISAMVLVGDLDNEIVKKLFGKLFGRYYKRLCFYIDFRQAESSKSWVNFEKLSKKWIEDDKS